MILTTSQSLIAKDKHRFRVLNTGRRFGKTTLAVEEIKGLALYTSEAKIAYIAPTYQQARDIAWEMLKKELQPIIKAVNESRLELTVNNTKGTTSQIILRGWESIETLRGQKFHFLVIDEVAMMRNFFAMWEEVLRPTLTDFKGQVMFISTPKGFNHFYELFNKEHHDSDYKSFQFTSYDNPHIPPEEIDKAKEEMTEDRFSQEYMADFRKTEGIVYKEFVRKIHLYTELPKVTITERLLGVDFGYKNPTAMALILKDTYGNYWIESEWYKTEQLNDQITETALTFKPNKVYPDPEAPEKVAELRKGGLNCMEVNKGKDSIKNGINKVRELLKQGRLKINAQCTNIIWEFETYAYPEKRPDNPEPEIPIKENDHLLDAIRYVLMTNKTPNVVPYFYPQSNQPNPAR